MGDRNTIKFTGWSEKAITITISVVALLVVGALLFCGFSTIDKEMSHKDEPSTNPWVEYGGPWVELAPPPTAAEGTKCWATGHGAVCDFGRPTCPTSP